MNLLAAARYMADKDGKETSTKYKSPTGQPCYVPPAEKVLIPAGSKVVAYLEAIDEHMIKLIDLLEGRFGPVIPPKESIIAPEGKEYTHYYYTPDTVIQVDTPNQPASPEFLTDGVNPGYQREQVFMSTGRIAAECTVNNDGTTDIFCIASSDGISWSDEAVIHRGEFRRFFSVYELRLRGPQNGILNFPINGDINNAGGGATITTLNQGGIYRISEHKLEFGAFNVCRTAIFVLSVIVKGPPAAGYTAITITGLFVNTKQAFRASVKNTDFVYYTYLGGDTTVAGKRGTLAPGDVLLCDITQGAEVFFSGNSAGQVIELTQESDISVP